jgi:hypothetical protein
MHYVIITRCLIVCDPKVERTSALLFIILFIIIFYHYCLSLLFIIIVYHYCFSLVFIIIVLSLSLFQTTLYIIVITIIICDPKCYCIIICDPKGERTSASLSIIIPISGHVVHHCYYDYYFRPHTVVMSALKPRYHTYNA